MIAPPILTKEMKLRACKKFNEEICFLGLSIDQIDDLAERSRWYSDGYELAKSLEDCCDWEINSGMVEDLDCLSQYINAEIKIERKKWFEENNIQPPFPIGTEIKEGVIDHIWDHDVAMYCVRRHGETDSSRFGIIKFENAKLKDGGEK